MPELLVLLFTVGFVAADVGLGYNYKPPTSFVTYGVPSYQASATAGQYNYDYNHANAYNYKYSTHNGNQGPTFGFQNAANNVYRGNGGYLGYKPSIIKGGALSTNNAFQNTFNPYHSGNNVYKETVAYQGENVGNYANVNGINKVQTFQNSPQLLSQPPQIFKHFYIHAAPEEEGLQKPRTPIVLPPPQKHYKIIFIKAPTQLTSTPQFIPVPQQKEEKTIVYVLVNKPEETQDIVLPKVEQKPPAKPEVYFIKYNNKEGSQAVIENIVKDYNNGQSTSFIDVGAGISPPPPLLLGTLGASGAQTVNGISASPLVSQNIANSGFGVQSAHPQVESGFELKPLVPITSGISDGALTSTIISGSTTDGSKVDGYNSAFSNTGFNSASSSTGFNGLSSNAGFNGATNNAGFNGVASNSGFDSATNNAGFNGVASNSGFDSATNNAGFNGITSNAGFNGATNNAGFNGATSNVGFNGATSNAAINSVSSSSGFNSASSSNGLNFGSSIASSDQSGSSGLNSAVVSGINSGSSENQSSGLSSGNNNSASVTLSTGTTGATSSVTDTEYKGSSISTSQGVPHETYGVPKFRE